MEDGAQVNEGTAIYSLEADKSVQEVEAPAAGRLRITAQAATEYPVGTLLGEIE